MASNQFLVIIVSIFFVLVYLPILGCSNEEKKEDIPSQPQNTYTEESIYTNSNNSSSEVAISAEPTFNKTETTENSFANNREISPDSEISSDLVKKYEENNNYTTQPVLATTTPPEKTTNSWDQEYEKLYQSIMFVHLKSSEIKENSSKLLNEQTPNDPVLKHKFMMTAVIGAVAAFWDGETNEARKLGQKAFEYRGDGIIDFPKEWNILKWWTDKSPKDAYKLAKAKDFVLSCSNGGLLKFQDANRVFIARGQFWDAIENYRDSLKLGLEDNDLRYAAHLRLAACLFKANKLQEAEEIFLQTWLVNHSLEIDFGDQPTRDYLDSLAKKYPTP